MSGLYIAATMALAGFVQGVTGFGFGMVSMALLPLVISVRAAAALSTVYMLLVTATTFLKNHSHYNWRLGVSFLLSCCAGVPIGVYLLSSLDERLLLRALGLFMIYFAVSEIALSHRYAPGRPMAVIPFGLFSGVLSGAFNLGGVPSAAYAYSRNWTQGQIVTFLQVVITLSCLLRIAIYGHEGFYRDFSWKFCLGASVPLFVAILAGNHLMLRLNPKLLRRIVFIFIGLFGIYYTFIH